MKTAAQELTEQRELFGEKVGRFEVTEMDVSERGPYMAMNAKGERLMIRKHEGGWWYARRATIHHMGWLVDDKDLCAAETLARLIEKIREVAK